MKPLETRFFDRDACSVAKDLLGKIIRRKYKGQWLAARIIETEAYYLEEKAVMPRWGSPKNARPCSCLPALFICITPAAKTPSM